MIDWLDPEKKGREFREFFNRACALDHNEDDDGEGTIEVQPAYIRVYRGKTRRTREQEPVSINYQTGDDPTALRRQVEDVLRGLATDARETIWIEAYCKGATNYRASFSGRMNSEEEDERPSRAGESDTLIKAYVETIRVLRGQNDELIGAMISNSRGNMALAEEYGSLRTRLELASEYNSAASIGKAIEVVGPVAVLALSNALAAQTSQKAPEVTDLPPRPERGAERVVWDVSAIEICARDLVQQWSADQNSVSDETLAKLEAFAQQAQQAVSVIKQHNAARATATPA